MPKITHFSIYLFHLKILNAIIINIKRLKVLIMNEKYQFIMLMLSEFFTFQDLFLLTFYLITQF